MGRRASRGARRDRENGRREAGAGFSWRPLLLFSATLLALAPLTHDRVFRGGNDAARFGLIEAIVDLGQTHLNGTRFGWTHDVVVIDGRDYSNKPPIVSVAGAAAYALLQAAGAPSFDSDEGAAAWWITLLLVGTTTAWLVARFDASLAAWPELPPWQRGLTTLSLAAGTILTSYSVTLQNHTIAAALLFAACHAAWRGRAVPAGTFGGLALCADIVPGLVFLPVQALLLKDAGGRRALVRYSVLVAGGALLFAGLNLWVHGSPMPPKFAPGAVDLSDHFGGAEPAAVNLPVQWLPRWTQPVEALFGWHGFFSVSPVLLLGAAGLLLAARSGEPLERRPPLLLGIGCAVLIAGHVLFVRSLGGWSFGYRYLVPIIPLLLFFAPAAMRRLPAAVPPAVLGLSMALALVGAYDPWPPVHEIEEKEDTAAELVRNPVGANLAAWLRDLAPGSGLARAAGSWFLDRDPARRDEYLLLFFRSRADEEAALRHLLRVRQERPDDPWAHAELAEAAAAAGQWEEAIAGQREAARLRPRDAGPRYRLGVALAMAGRLDEALAQLEQALGRDPQLGVAADAAARVLLARPGRTAEDSRRALELAQRAATLTGRRDPEVLETLAAAHATAGDREGALVAAEEALELFPPGSEDPRAAVLREALERYRRLPAAAPARPGAMAPDA